MIVILDSGIIHTICSFTNTKEVADCQEWFYRLLARSVYFVTSEICDYEVRRELIRKNKVRSINSLDELRQQVDILPLNRQILLEAAKLWATARQQNRPTSSNKNIDVDMILSAQWILLKQEYPGQYIVIATTNTKHLSLFTEAKEWKDIHF